MTGGRFSETLKFVKDTFKDASLKMIAVMKTGMEIMTKISSAAMKDFIGYIQNFYYENQGKILAAMAVGTMLGTMGPKALSLQGLALTALVGSVAGAVGSYFGENSVEKMQKDLDVVNQKIVKDEYKDEMLSLLTGIHFNTHNISGYVATAFINHYNKFKNLMQRETNGN